MGKLLDKVIFDNTVFSYLLSIGSILLALLFKKYLSQYIAGLLFRLAKRTSWQIDRKAFVELLLAPLQGFLLVLISFIALDKLHFPKMLLFDIHHITSRQIVDSIGNGLLIVTFIWLLLRVIDFIALILDKRTNEHGNLRENQLIVFFRDFFKVIIGIIGLLLIIQFSFNKDIGPLLAGFGIIGAAVALAAKESLENLIASFIIFFDKPFTVGDIVKVQQFTGTVEKIGLRSTRVRTDYKTYVTVPNKQMVDSIMDNLTLRTQRRADIRLELSLGSSKEQIQQLLDQIRDLCNDPLILSKSILFNDIISNAFVITIEYYTGAIAAGQFNEVKQKINFGILSSLNQLGIELAGMNTEIRLTSDGKPK